MNVDEVRNRLADFEGDMQVIVSDGDYDYVIDTINDDGVDKVVILAGNEDK
jgi:hypothetical protein